MRSLLHEWIAYEKKKRKQTAKLIAGVASIIVFSVATLVHVHASEPDMSVLHFEDGNIVSPEGYEMMTMKIMASKGETIEQTARELIEKFAMENIVTLRDYELVFFMLNTNVQNPRKDFKSGYEYIWPYWFNVPEGAEVDYD